MCIMTFSHFFVLCFKPTYSCTLQIPVVAVYGAVIVVVVCAVLAFVTRKLCIRLLIYSLLYVSLFWCQPSHHSVGKDLSLVSPLPTFHPGRLLSLKTLSWFHIFTFCLTNSRRIRCLGSFTLMSGDGRSMLNHRWISVCFPNAWVHATCLSIKVLILGFLQLKVLMFFFF